MFPKRREFVFKSLFRKRVQAILTDPEDVFGNPNYMGAAELAARLGSINTFERRGTTVFMDNFESSTLKWVSSLTGTGAAAVRSNASAKNGDYSIKLTTGNAEDNYAKLVHYNYFPVSTRLGFEVSFALGSDIKYFSLWTWSYSGTHEIIPQMHYYPQTNLLKIFDENSNPITIASGLNLFEADLLYHTLKLVFDISTNKYVRAYCDKYEYDISEYEYPHQVSSATPILLPEFDVHNNAAGNHYVYADDFILTQNEP